MGWWMQFSLDIPIFHIHALLAQIKNVENKTMEYKNG